MPYISKEQYQDYLRFCKDRNHGRILTPEGLRLICEACRYDAKAIGEHFLERLAQIKYR